VLVEPEMARLKMIEPLWIAGSEVCSVFDIDVTVSGGGVMGQADACRMAIAKGIVEFTGDLSIRDRFIASDRSMLKGDTRRTETHKPNRSSSGPRAKRQKRTGRYHDSTIRCFTCGKPLGHLYRNTANAPQKGKLKDVLDDLVFPLLLRRCS
jgi:small subunit ribosomal protein S9